MDMDEKHPGITHVSFKVSSIDAAKAFLAERGIPLSGQFSFKDLRAVFIRDPDRNVIELDAYAGDEPETRAGEPASSPATERIRSRAILSLQGWGRIGRTRPRRSLSMGRRCRPVRQGTDRPGRFRRTPRSRHAGKDRPCALSG